MFNYSTSSDVELLQHITSSSSASVSVAKRYHKSKGNFDVVERIDRARKLLKMRRLKERAEKIEKEMMEGSV